MWHVADLPGIFHVKDTTLSVHCAAQTMKASAIAPSKGLKQPPRNWTTVIAASADCELSSQCQVRHRTCVPVQHACRATCHSDINKQVQAHASDFSSLVTAKIDDSLECFGRLLTTLYNREKPCGDWHQPDQAAWQLTSPPWSSHRL